MEWSISFFNFEVVTQKIKPSTFNLRVSNSKWIAFIFQFRVWLLKSGKCQKVKKSKVKIFYKNFRVCDSKCVVILRNSILWHEVVTREFRTSKLYIKSFIISISLNHIAVTISLFWHCKQICSRVLIKNRRSIQLKL